LSDLAAHIGQSMEPEQRKRDDERKHSGSASHTITPYFVLILTLTYKTVFLILPARKRKFLSKKAILNILLLLELKGRISQLSGKTFIRKEQ